MLKLTEYVENVIVEDSVTFTAMINCMKFIICFGVGILFKSNKYAVRREHFWMSQKPECYFSRLV